jgi:hypothetical protein
MYALGANNTLEGVAVLTNEINRMLKALKPGEKPTQAGISALFHCYQEEHKPRMKLSYDMSYDMTRLQTCDGLINRINMMYILPYKGFSVLADPLANMSAGAPKFDFIPVKYNKIATVKWKDEGDPVSKGHGEGKVSSIGGKVKKISALLLGIACVALLSFFVSL